MNIVDKFLQQSNWIEAEYGERAMRDAVKAWDYLYSHRKEKLKLKHILKVHSVLMKNLNKNIAGKLREQNVYIGGECKEFKGLFKLKKELGNFINAYEYIYSSRHLYSREELETKIRENHVLYENIHPFVDGNGRSGRILYNLLRKKCGLSIHVIQGKGKDDDGYPKEQLDYYKWFQDFLQLISLLSINLIFLISNLIHDNLLFPKSYSTIV